MKIEYHRYFLKVLRKKPAKIKLAFTEALKLFSSEPFHKSLNNHTLKGELKGLRGFNVTGDIRVHYKDDGFFVTLMNIGTHSELYK